MACQPHTTPARRNPTWTPAPYPLGPLAKFFGGGEAAPVVQSPAPRRPAPAMVLA